MTVYKHDEVKITGNSIFEIMGYHEVTGIVFHIRDTGFSFKCNETGMIETCDYDDGIILVLPSAVPAFGLSTHFLPMSFFK